jgi:hypothetical protein
MRLRASPLFGVVLAASCAKPKEDKPAPTTFEDTAGGLLGINPEKWECENVAPIDALASILGGEVTKVDPQMSTPRGLAKPCTYTVGRSAAGPRADAGVSQLEVWTFDLDCRPGYDDRAHQQLDQWAARSEELVAEYHRQVRPGGKPPANDAGVAYRAPEGARELAIGRRALDVLGQGIIFIDDDAPCNVRVVGPDAERRLALAQLIATNLTEANAPMTPHAREVIPQAP